MAGGVTKGGIINIGEFKAKMKGLHFSDRAEMIQKACEAGALTVEGYARINAVRTLNRNPIGNLAASITHKMRWEGKVSWADIGPTVVYGRIHELGGFIEPTKAKLLHWIDKSGISHFAKKVYIPARPYLRPALEDHVDEVVAAVKTVLADEIKKATGK